VTRSDASCLAFEQRDQDKAKEREEERRREQDRESELRKEKVPVHANVGAFVPRAQDVNLIKVSSFVSCSLFVSCW